MVTVKPIRTEEDLDAALVRIEEIFFAEPGTPEGDELDVLGTLVEAYEDRHHPIGPPSIPGAIEFAIDQRMATESDLVSIFGSRAKLSQALAGELDLTMPMARALHKRLGIPAEVLLQEPGADLDAARAAAD